MDLKMEALFKEFAINGKLIKLKANKEGHINSTFISTFENNGISTKYTHQKINKTVFIKPNQVMENITKVTNHIQSKINDLPDKDKRCLELIKTKKGEYYFIDKDGNYWRTYKYIDDVKTFSKIEDKKHAFLLGQAIGTFQKQLQDFDGNSLHETIKDFHNMYFRYENLDKAILMDSQNRVSLVKEELDFLMANRERGCIIWKEMKDKKIPLRVTHNDTKINNVLFDNDEKEALCIIDLDTVMPGSTLFDTGDMIRTATSTAEEDEIDISLMKCNVDYFEALISGYKSIADEFLTDREKELIVESGRNITQIMAIRFLTDYLMGDVYYAIDKPNHNLDRTRTQIALIKDMDIKWEQLNNCIK